MIKKGGYFFAGGRGEKNKKMQPRSQGLFPGLGAGREKALTSAHRLVTCPLYTLKFWV